MDRERSEITKIVELYRKELKKIKIKANRIILFGSYAKGDWRVDSDIDLLVVSVDFKGMDLRQRLEILGKTAARIMKPIEARGYTPEELAEISPTSYLSETVARGINM